MNAHMRYRNPDGTTKDWLIEETLEGFRTRWGRTGQVNQEKTFERKRYPAGIYSEMRKRIQAQLRQGYGYVGGIPAGCPQGTVWLSTGEPAARTGADASRTLTPSPASPPGQTSTKSPEAVEAPVWDLSRSRYPLFL